MSKRRRRQSEPEQALSLNTILFVAIAVIAVLWAAGETIRSNQNGPLDIAASPTPSSNGSSAAGSVIPLGSSDITKPGDVQGSSLNLGSKPNLQGNDTQLQSAYPVKPGELESIPLGN